MDAKVWYQSRTFWVNLVVIVLAALAYVLEGVTSGSLELPGVSPEGVAFVLGLVNLLLRFVTTKPVALK